MKIGPTPRIKQETLGTALAVAGKPTRPPRPFMHRNGPPTMAYHHNHPMLTSPATPAPLPVRATQGVSQNALGAYLRALGYGN
jgi:hypothetical protein